MIRKLLISLAVIAATTFGASSQGKELTVSYGGYTQMDAMDMHDGWHGVNTAWGALNVGFNFQINSKFWIGPSYTFSSTTTKGGPHHSNIAYHAFMINGRYQYYRSGLFSMYAKAGLGIEFSHMQPRGDDAYNKCYCAFQLVPIGAQFDLNRTVALFAEAGFGAQGLFQAGCKFRF